MHRSFRELLIRVMLVALVAGVLSSSATAAVIPGGSTVEGKTLAEWSAEWWKWALSFPIETNPLVDVDGSRAHVGDVGPVFFMGGIFDLEDTSPTATRSFTVPVGKRLFFPILNAIFFVSSPGEILGDAIDYVTGVASAATDLHATIDGIDVPNLSSHREASPIFEVTVPENNLFASLGLPAGTYAPAVSDGFWLMLEPLSPGTHVITFGGTSGDFSLDVTNNIQVVPEPGTLTLLLAAFAAIAGRRLIRH
jgi:hypothetical protein